MCVCEREREMTQPTVVCLIIYVYNLALTFVSSLLNSNFALKRPWTPHDLADSKSLSLRIIIDWPGVCPSFFRKIYSRITKLKASQRSWNAESLHTPSFYQQLFFFFFQLNNKGKITLPVHRMIQSFSLALMALFSWTDFLRMLANRF